MYDSGQAQVKFINLVSDEKQRREEKGTTLPAGTKCEEQHIWVFLPQIQCQFHKMPHSTFQAVFMRSATGPRFRTRWYYGVKKKKEKKR